MSVADTRVHFYSCSCILHRNKGENIYGQKKITNAYGDCNICAIGLVLDQISFKVWAQGGSVSLVMVPIVLMAFRWGLTAGLTTGLLVGVIQTMFGAYIVHWLQGLLDYGVAFTVVGLATIVRQPLLEALNIMIRQKWYVIL